MDKEGRAEGRVRKGMEREVIGEWRRRGEEDGGTDKGRGGNEGGCLRGGR